MREQPKSNPPLPMENSPPGIHAMPASWRSRWQAWGEMFPKLRNWFLRRPMPSSSTTIRWRQKIPRYPPRRKNSFHALTTILLVTLQTRKTFSGLRSGSGGVIIMHSFSVRRGSDDFMPRQDSFFAEADLIFPEAVFLVLIGALVCNRRE